MQMGNQFGQGQGIKLGHNKTGNSTATANETQGNSVLKETRRSMIASDTSKTVESHTAQSDFKLPCYEPIKLQRLPAAPQLLFQKELLLDMLEAFSQHMFDAIFNNDINVPPSITLGLNAMSDINVLGNHPDQSKIENLFSNHSALEMEFQQIAFTSRVQQLSNLLPGFKGDFFAYTSHSIEQISFVHMRSVALKPLQMTIAQADQIAQLDPAEKQTDRAYDKSISSGVFIPLQLILSRSEQAPSILSAAEDEHASEKTLENAHHIKANAEEPEKEKRRHVHKSKLKCIIND